MTQNIINHREGHSFSIKTLFRLNVYATANFENIIESFRRLR